jgi:hypothetical protein
MEVVKEKATKKSLNVEVLTGNGLFELQQAIQKTLSTSTRMKGKDVRIFLENLMKIDPVVVPLIEEHSKVVKEFAKKNEDGGPVRDNNGFHFESEENKATYEAASEKIWNSEISIELVKFPVEIFDSMEFNMKENNTVYLILKHLVV